MNRPIDPREHDSPYEELEAPRMNLSQWKKEALEQFIHNFTGPLAYNIDGGNAKDWLNLTIDRIHAHTLEEVRGKVEKVQQDTDSVPGVWEVLDKVLELLEHPTN